ncbi:MAG: sulfate transporter CysZ [Magnetococcus sp. WYHC-3]
MQVPSSNGVPYLLKGIGMLVKPGLKRFVLAPLLLNVSLFSWITWYAFHRFQSFLDWLMGYVPTWLGFLEVPLYLLFGLSAMMVVYFTFSMVANVLGAPFNSLLSEHVEKHLTGSLPQGSPGGMGPFFRRVIPLVMSELGKLVYFVAWSVPVLVLFLIPGAQPVAVVVWGLYSAWMLAVEYADVPMGNHGMSHKQVRARLAGNRVASFSFGGAVLVLTSIPGLNLIAMPAAVAGATVMWVELCTRKMAMEQQRCSVS